MARKPTYEELEERVRGLQKEAAKRELAEQALRESEEKLRALFEACPDGILVMDIETKRYRYANEASCKLLGYSEEEITGLGISDVHPEDKLEYVMSEFEAHVKGQITSAESVPFLRKDGTIVYVDISGTPVVIDGKNCSIGFLRDITERRRAEEALRRAHDELEQRVEERTAELIEANEQLKRGIEERKRAVEALRESEEKYRGLFENSTDFVYTLDLKGNFTNVNHAAEHLTGYTKAELVGMSYRDYVSSLAYRRVLQAFSRILKTGEPLQDYLLEVTVRDGSNKYFETSATLLWERGEIVGFQGSSRDITERKRAEEALGVSEERYRCLVENIDLGITLIDSEHNIVMTNAAHGRLFNKPISEFVGKKCYREFQKREAVCPHCPGAQAMATGQPTEAETEGVRDDGTRFSARVRAFPAFQQAGVVTGFIEIVEDITERKRLEARLQQVQKMEAIGTLAGGLAHDFNNLLMGIQGNISLMLLNMESVDPNYDRVQDIAHQVQSGATLTSRLLGYARKGKYEVKTLSLNQLVEKTSHTFGRTRKDIEVHLDLAADLSAVEADVEQIEQVLWNLFINAADAMPDGGDLILKTANTTHEDMKRKVYEPKPGNYVRLTVTDTGTGMDKNTVERIYDPFFTTKEMGRGTGLGLASTFGIMKGHGGYIDVDSKKGHGTTFSIYLPASEKRVHEAVRHPEQFIRGSETVLLVDDEKSIRQVGKDLLEAMGYQVLLATSGEEAIDVYQRHRDNIDIVLLDMVMPRMRGGKTYDRIKEIDPDVKVLLSSGYSIDGEATEILERGCDGFIQKPFNMKELSARLREILDRQ